MQACARLNGRGVLFVGVVGRCCRAVAAPCLLASAQAAPYKRYVKYEEGYDAYENPPARVAKPWEDMKTDTYDPRAANQDPFPWSKELDIKLKKGFKKWGPEW